MNMTLDEMHKMAETSEVPEGFTLPEITDEEPGKVRLLSYREGDVITFPCPSDWTPDQMKMFSNALVAYLVRIGLGGVSPLVVPHTCPMVVIRKESE